MTHSLDDIGLIPSVVSDIDHRESCNPYNEDDMLPIFTAPMNAVIDNINYQTFLNHKINTVIPRGVDFEIRKELAIKTFVAFGLDEFTDFYWTIPDDTENIYYICIDIAQGHMSKLLKYCKAAKERFGHRMIIMTGNIANPETYLEYAKVGIDFVRCSVGSGSCCTTGKNLGVYYGLASLIREVYQFKQDLIGQFKTSEQYGITCPFKSIPIIIADGGFDTTDKILKALTLGADYVMLGEQFAQCQEACGETVMKTIYLDEIITTKVDKTKTIKKVENIPANVLHRVYYGMSTKRAQKETGKSKLRTAEGIQKYVPINTNLEKWTTEFKDNLQSLMSYANTTNLEGLKQMKYKIKYVRS